MKNTGFNPLWLLLIALVVGIWYLLKKANDKFKNDPNISYPTQDLLEPTKVEQRKEENVKPNASVFVNANLLRIRDSKGNYYIDSRTKQMLYFQKEDGNIGEYIGNKIFGQIKYVAVKKTPAVAQKWAVKGMAGVDTVYLAREFVTIK